MNRLESLKRLLVYVNGLQDRVAEIERDVESGRRKYIEGQAMVAGMLTAGIDHIQWTLNFELKGVETEAAASYALEQSATANDAVQFAEGF